MFREKTNCRTCLSDVTFEFEANDVATMEDESAYRRTGKLGMSLASGTGTKARTC